MLTSLVGCLAISARFRLKARRASEQPIRRSDESIGLILGRLFVGLPLFASVLAYIVHPPVMAWAEVKLPMSLRWTGAVLGLSCIPLVYWVMSSIGTNISETVLTRADQQLITNGPYRFIRHPLYSFGALMLLAQGLMASNGFILACTLLATLMIRFLIIPPEERELRLRFGEQYADYQRRTGRLLPRLAGSR